MRVSDTPNLKRTIYSQILGSSILLTVLLGLIHNAYLSSGSLVTGPIPSTHPLTAAGFAILAGAIFFRPAWDRSLWLRHVLCLAMIVLSGLRLAEALFPDTITFYSRGPVPELLATIGLHGRFSVETAIFLTCCFCFELTRERHIALRLLLISICLAVLSLGFTETVYSLFLWGNELSLITQLAMWLVSVDLLVRMRERQPFQSFFQYGKSSFYLQIAALSLYLMPMIAGAIYLQVQHVTAEQRLPFELVFAGASCVMLAIVLALGSYLDRDGNKPRDFAPGGSGTAPRAAQENDDRDTYY